jgi:hypothetical protein
LRFTVAVAIGVAIVVAITVCVPISVIKVMHGVEYRIITGRSLGAKDTGLFQLADPDPGRFCRPGAFGSSLVSTSRAVAVTC